MDTVDFASRQQNADTSQDRRSLVQEMRKTTHVAEDTINIINRSLGVDKIFDLGEHKSIVRLSYELIIGGLLTRVRLLFRSASIEEVQNLLHQATFIAEQIEDATLRARCHFWQGTLFADDSQELKAAEEFIAAIPILACVCPENDQLRQFLYDYTDVIENYLTDLHITEEERRDFRQKIEKITSDVRSSAKSPMPNQARRNTERVSSFGTVLMWLDQSIRDIQNGSVAPVHSRPQTRSKEVSADHTSGSPHTTVSDLNRREQSPSFWSGRWRGRFDNDKRDAQDIVTRRKGSIAHQIWEPMPETPTQSANLGSQRGSTNSSLASDLLPEVMVEIKAGGQESKHEQASQSPDPTILALNEIEKGGDPNLHINNDPTPLVTTVEEDKAIPEEVPYNFNATGYDLEAEVNMEHVPGHITPEQTVLPQDGDGLVKSVPVLPVSHPGANQLPTINSKQSAQKSSFNIERSGTGNLFRNRKQDKRRVSSESSRLLSLAKLFADSSNKKARVSSISSILSSLERLYVEPKLGVPKDVELSDTISLKQLDERVETATGRRRSVGTDSVDAADIHLPPSPTTSQRTFSYTSDSSQGIHSRRLSSDPASPSPLRTSTFPEDT